MTQQHNKFKKWFDEKLNDIEFQAIADENLCLLVWQAATAESDKRIAELEGEADLADIVISVNERQLKEKDLKITELQAHINVLREALKEVRICGLQNSSNYKLAANLMNTAYTETPAQSLQAHDNELLESAATVARMYAAERHEQAVVEAIRALK